MGRYIQFSTLKIGDRFRFASEETMPHAGMAHGPWVKISSRRYVPFGGDPKATHQVGTVKVLVFLDPQEQPCE